MNDLSKTRGLCSRSSRSDAIGRLASRSQTRPNREDLFFGSFYMCVLFWGLPTSPFLAPGLGPPPEDVEPEIRSSCAEAMQRWAESSKEAEAGSRGWRSLKADMAKKGTPENWGHLETTQHKFIFLYIRHNYVNTCL